MEIVQRFWTNEKLAELQDRINLNPAWQRGPAWHRNRQVLLIDSILRGMDIPKIYLRALSRGDVFRHEAVDGQQRLRAIWEFRAGEFALTYPDGLSAVDGRPVSGLTYNELHKSLRDRFDNFKVSVAEIIAATSDEITNLFSRLQMGVSLNPAELRNALGGPMRHVIDVLGTSHKFFTNSKIPAARYKWQDYVTHVCAMVAYGGHQDIKAPDLKKMVLDFGPDRAAEVLSISERIGEALNVLAAVNELVGYRITQKWLFVDLCWLIIKRHEAGAVVDPSKLAAAYKDFEDRRRAYIGRADDLIRGSKHTALDRHLYDYINAFRAQGGIQANLIARATALRAFLPNIDARS
jgi:hypothetical protein